MPAAQWKVAILGAGPAGMFAAEALTSRPDVQVDIFERVFAPDGLLRFGVAPDHSSIKRLSKNFDKTRDRENVRLFAGVEIGKDVSIDALKTHYHAILFATGAGSDRKLGIEGEDSAGVYSSREFVEWYNGHPDEADAGFPLDAEEVVVVGAGNVALDVARLLLRPAEDLAVTDVATHALEAFRRSKVRRVHMLIRRGPADVAFTLPEIRALASMDGVQVVIPEKDFVLSNADRGRMGMDRGLSRIVEVLETCVSAEDADRLPEDGRRVLRLHFFSAPQRIVHENGAMVGVELLRNAVDEEGRLTPDPSSRSVLPATKLLRAIGYKVEPIQGLPYNERSSTIHNEQGRVTDATGAPLDGNIWVTGWARRGPSGVVGTNKADAQEVAASILAGFVGAAPARSEWSSDSVPVIRMAAWRKLDAEEQRRGAEQGREREKFVRFADVLEFLNRDVDA